MFEQHDYKDKWNEILNSFENTKHKENSTELPKQEITIGEYRLIPKGTKFWSIKNQLEILLDEDVIVEINQSCHGSDAVFVIPKQLIFNFAGYFPTIIGRGSDEWLLSYSKTLEYTVPEYKPLIITYNE